MLWKMKHWTRNAGMTKVQGRFRRERMSLKVINTIVNDTFMNWPIWPFCPFYQKSHHSRPERGPKRCTLQEPFYIILKKNLKCDVSFYKVII